MKQSIIRLVKSITPPIATDLFRHLSDTTFEFSGNYRTWDEACRASSGFDSEAILDRVKNAILKVKKGEAVYERDSVLFDKVEYSWPLIAGLLWVASRNGNKINLVDFGGSLGSTYYQNLKFLNHLENLQWSIIEQEIFVNCGKRLFENDHIRFYHNLNECFAERHPKTILFSGVIQYLENPYELLAEVVNHEFTYIIFDRTPFLVKGDDRITVQNVKPDIYPASYPAWFFNLQKFQQFFSEKYDLIADFESSELYYPKEITAQSMGFIYSLK